MGVLFGQHRAKNGETFTYHLTFERAGNAIRWRAIVRDGAGALVGTPKGMLAPSDADELDDLVRREVGRAIDLVPPRSQGTG